MGNGKKQLQQNAAHPMPEANPARQLHPSPASQPYSPYLPAPALLRRNNPTPDRPTALRTDPPLPRTPSPLPPVL